MTAAAPHYLESEINARFRDDPQMWQFIQHGSLDGVWYWDLENPENEWMSREMWELFGVDPATKRHDPAEWQDLIFQEDLAVAIENFEKHCADPDHPYDQVVRYRHADGSTVWVRCRGIAIRDETGKPIWMLGAHNDLTAIKVAEQDLRSSLSKTAAANEDLKSFAHGISHDLKSPSNTMAMLLTELAESDHGTLTKDQCELIALAQDTATHMCDLVEDMLAYTRLIGEDPVFEVIPVADIAGKARQVLGALVSETDAEIILDDDLPDIYGTPAQLKTLVQNLLENAIKFRHPDRQPRIKVSRADLGEPDRVGFSISDNGVGIPAALQGRIFGLFKRLHRADEVPGSGIGLTLCRRVMLNHKGDILVSSEPEKGTTFTLSFPRFQT